MIINFFRGPRASYSQTLHGTGIYFATDTLEIIHDGKSYSGLLEVGKSVKDITLVNGVMTITYTDLSTTTVEVGSGKYQSNIEDKTLAMPNAVGGIAKNTKLSALEGKSYDYLFDNLLFPTVNPTFTAPSASIALKNYAATQEVGSAAPTAASNFTVGYNAGEIKLNGSKQANRGGAQDTANSFIYYGSSANNTTLPTTVAEGSTSYKYRAAYAQGPQPKDNKGNDYSSPLAAGTVDSSAVTVNGTWPWFATTATAGTLTKQSLIAWNATAGSMVAGGSTGFDLQPHTVDVPQQFKLPREASSMQMYNTVAKSFETAALSDWTKESGTETINGQDRTYYTYSYKGANRGSVKLIVNF
jgi:hypothetical protein